MKKGFMLPLENNDKMAASDYAITVFLKSDEVVELKTTQYAFSDVFDYIEEYFQDKNDEAVANVAIKLVR